MALMWSKLVLLMLMGICPAMHAKKEGARPSKPNPPSPAIPTQCPTWLQEYAVWHKANRGKPDATYLMYGPCLASLPCTGLGDRVKSSMTLLRLAAMYNKVLLLEWDYVMPVTRVLKPQAIDWRYDQSLKKQLQNRTSRFDASGNLAVGKPLYEVIVVGKHLDEFREAKIVRSQVWRDFDRPISGANITDLKMGYAALGRCFFQFLFQPTTELLARSDKVLQGLYGSGMPQYIAWHWRSGGMEGELVLNRPAAIQADGSTRLHQLIAGTLCAHDMAAGNGLRPLSATPLLLITDHNIIRRFVAHGAFRYVTTPNISVVHVSTGRQVTTDDEMNSWVDIALLSRAQCLIMSPSGFSWLAYFMSSTTCHMDLHTCLTGQKQLFEGGQLR